MPKPVIKVIGDKRFRAKKGETFVDPGAQTSGGSLVIDNQVDTSQIGIYYVTYQSTNESGTTLEEREVIVSQDGVCGINIGSGRGSFRSFMFGETYKLSTTDTELVEGEQFTVTLNTTNVPTGSTVAYTITGVESSDINGADLTGEFIINRSFSSITFTTSDIDEDKLLFLGLDDHESEFIEVSIINDPNAQTYELNSNVGVVQEGGTVTVTLDTFGVSNGTSIPYTITGVESSDINGADLTGNFVVNNNKATLNLSITEDGLVEGTETLVVSLVDRDTSVSVAITDKPPTYQLTTTSNNVNEGESFTVTLVTTNIPDNAILQYNITGVDTEDINYLPTTGVFKVVDNTAELTVYTSADGTPDGTDTFVLTLVDDPSASVSVTINDTSTEPEADPATYLLTRDKTAVDEGDTFKITLYTTNVPNGTSVPYGITGVTTADIGGEALNSTFVVNGGEASKTFTATADDLTEGPETFRLSLTLIEDKFVEVTINDTSTEPTGENERDPTGVDNPDAGKGPNPEPGTGPLDIGSLDMFIQVGQIEEASGGYAGVTWEEISPYITTDPETGDPIATSNLLINNININVDVGQAQETTGGYAGVSWDDIRPDAVVDSGTGESTISYMQIGNVEVGVNMKYLADNIGSDTGSVTFGELVGESFYVYDIDNVELNVSVKGDMTSQNAYNVWSDDTRLPEDYVEDTYWDLELTGTNDPFTQTILPDILTSLNSLP